MSTKKRRKVKPLLPPAEDLLPPPEPLLPEPPPKKKPRMRVAGIGRECTKCGGRNTKVRDTKQHPQFITQRRRCWLCGDCGNVDKRTGERP